VPALAFLVRRRWCRAAAQRDEVLLRAVPEPVCPPPTPIERPLPPCPVTPAAAHLAGGR
jgi:hypothetical protein